MAAPDPSRVTLQFGGAAETVTGSRHLFRLGNKQVLVDCGLFQGPRNIRERNWEPFPIPPASLDAVVLTHAHMDHIGWLPRLVREGYTGPIYCTSATESLAKISLPDSGRLQEEEARYRNKHGLTRHQPALPLYTEQDAYATLKQFQPVPYHTLHQLPGGAQWQYRFAGHILGSAFVELYFANGERIMMSGDLGRYNMPLIKDPEPVDFAEYLVIESTYGDRLHETDSPETHLERVLNAAWQAGSCVIVPSFAIGRTQELLYFIKKLQDANRIPRVPIFVDSPMASKATLAYARHTEEMDSEAAAALAERDSLLEPDDLVWIRDREQSKELNVRRGPMMVISGSGMANGGRVVHHLMNRLPDASTVVLFTGYQAEGTLGRALLEGNEEVEVMGRPVRVRAQIERMGSLSAHADQSEILRWLGEFRTPPKRTFLVHGEPPAQTVLAEKIRRELGWDVHIPKHLETVNLAQ